MAEIDIEQNENEQEIKVKQRCRCTKGAKGDPCSVFFSEETVLSNLNNCLKISSSDLHLVTLANIQTFTRTELIGSKRNHSPRCNFLYQPIPICKDMFLSLYGISFCKFRRLKVHYEHHRMSSRVHGNCKRLPTNDVNNFSLTM